jgi:hypothetical protein
MCFQFKAPLKVEPKRGLGTLQLERKKTKPKESLASITKTTPIFFSPSFSTHFSLFIFLLTSHIVVYGHGKTSCPYNLGISEREITWIQGQE